MEWGGVKFGLVKKGQEPEFYYNKFIIEKIVFEFI